MRVENKIDGKGIAYAPTMKCSKGYKYLILGKKDARTTLYIVQQKGERSWIANLFSGTDGHVMVNGNSGTILPDCVERFDTYSIFRVLADERIPFRKAIMEFCAYGTIGVTPFNINKVED